MGAKHRSTRHVHCVRLASESAPDRADHQDRTVQIHTRSSPSVQWSSVPLLPKAPESQDPHFADAVWRVSWSLAGNILAVSCGDGKVSLWKEGVDLSWECVSDFSS
jgi:protein transport protein SEC13